MKFYLRVKRVPFEVVLTLELVGVRLTHDQAVLIAPEDVRLIHDLKTTPAEVSFSLNHNNSLPFPGNAKPCCLLLVGVFIDHLGKPELLNAFLNESVQGLVDLEVLICCPVLLPDHGDLKLNLDGVVFLVDVDKLKDVNRG